MPQIFDDDVNEAFDSELDKLFGEEDDLFAEDDDPALFGETAVGSPPATNTNTNTSALTASPPKSTHTISLAEAAAQGLLPPNLIERLKK
jgi:hypothetical protein